MPGSKSEKRVFLSIILIASVLRFWNYWGWSYSHDELGAFIRLHYSSFSDLISEGVQNNDTHPAFVQVLLFLWTSVFGLSALAVRLPFVLAGIGSVALVYFIARKWFGPATACFSSLTIAILDFPILYSQLARPYSFGLFFSLLAVWCWTHLLFGDNKKYYLKAVGYGMATALCMYTHYFSFFFAMLVALTGFAFLNKQTWKPYLASGLIALLLFIPHINVSLHQFGMGGVGEWLAKPESDYLWKFVQYGFNESTLVIVFLAGVFLLSILIYHIDISISKFHFVCIAWFMIPFTAGYYYSVMINPVLQYSTLLFSFPFLPIFLFSFLKERHEKMNYILFMLTGIVLLYSTVIEQRFFKREYFGVFKEISQAVTDLQKQYGKENLTTVLNTSSKEIMDFYFKQNEQLVSYDFFAGDSPDCTAKMLDRIDSCKTPYFLYCWSNFRSPYEIPELIKRKYPCILYDEKHFNSQITLFGKNDSCKRDTVFYRAFDFERNANDFSFDKTKMDTTHAKSGKHSLFIDSKNEFCITLKTPVKNIFREERNCVNISAWIFASDTFNAQVVVDIGQPGSPKRDWQAKLLHEFVTKKGNWRELFTTFELPASAYPDDEVTIYLWNPGKNNFYLDDFSISSFADSRYDYYEITYRK